MPDSGVIAEQINCVTCDDAEINGTVVPVILASGDPIYITAGHSVADLPRPPRPYRDHTATKTRPNPYRDPRPTTYIGTWLVGHGWGPVKPSNKNNRDHGRTYTKGGH